ncbi:MAG: twin-arginine translocase TatA/TatE family subunit [Methylococcaceae bacterium]|nr:twin-arginine translocase TatA/TatE family subunit [Methylococcaceae bacterium]
MGISVTKLLIILAIVIIFFGTKRLKNVGSDLGAAIKGFRAAIKDGEDDTSTANSEATDTKSKQDEKG